MKITQIMQIMQVTILGYILIPVGIALLFFNNKYLLYAAIVSCGLTGSSVFNIDDVALQPAQYFALLWMLKLLAGVFKAKRIRVCKDKPVVRLGIFLLISLVSLIMPIILRNKAVIMNVDGAVVNLAFTSSNITQTVYLVFCVLFFVNFYQYLCRNRDEIIRIRRLYVISVILVCMITLYQIVAYKTEMPFDVIFKMGFHGNKSGSIFWDQRISGPCLEASMLAYYIVPALPVTARLKNKFMAYAVTGILITLGFISVSSTFLVGAALWVFFEGIFLLKSKRVSKKIKNNILIFFSCTVVVILILIILGKLQSITDGLMLSQTSFLKKIYKQSVSGTERSEAFFLLIKAFSKSVLLGVGFGSCRGKDLFSTWLADIGILGCASMFAFVYSGIKNSGASAEWKLATILVWFCMLVSVPEPYNLFIWIIMGIMMSDCERKRA